MSDLPPRRPNADWRPEFPPLAISVRGADGDELDVGVTYETPDKRPIVEIRKGRFVIRLTAAPLRKIAQLATDHERRDERRRGERR